MLDCAWQPEWQSEPTTMPKSAARSNAWLAASLVLLAVCAAAVLGNLASDDVMR